MPSNLYRRGRTWWARIQVQGRDHRRSLRTSTRSEAIKRLRTIVEEVEHFKFHGEQRRTWKAVVAEWGMHGTGGVKASTLQRYQVSLRQLRPYLDHLYLDEISRKKVAEIARRPGVTNATRRRDLTAMSVVLRYCVAQGWREDNPAREWDRGIIGERRDPIVLPSEADIAAVIELAPGNFARLIRFAQYTGMRQDEVVTLERRQVRERERRCDLWRTKTNRPRTLLLDDRAVGTYAGTPIYATSVFVFWHDEGEPYRNVASRFRALVQRAEKSASEQKRQFRPFRFHDLRHWFAVDALRRGMSIYDLQKHLGHASIKTTELYLAHLDADEQRRARNEAGTIAGTDVAV